MHKFYSIHVHEMNRNSVNPKIDGEYATVDNPILGIDMLLRGNRLESHRNFFFDDMFWYMWGYEPPDIDVDIETVKYYKPKVTVDGTDYDNAILELMTYTGYLSRSLNNEYYKILELLDNKLETTPLSQQQPFLFQCCVKIKKLYNVWCKHEYKSRYQIIDGFLYQLIYYILHDLSDYTDQEGRDRIAEILKAIPVNQDDRMDSALGYIGGMSGLKKLYHFKYQDQYLIKQDVTTYEEFKNILTCWDIKTPIIESYIEFDCSIKIVSPFISALIELDLLKNGVVKQWGISKRFKTKHGNILTSTNIYNHKDDDTKNEIVELLRNRLSL